MKLQRMPIIAFFIAATLTFTGCNGPIEDTASAKEAHAQLMLPPEPDSIQMASIVQTARIWGFAKYHHPRIFH